MIKKEIRSTYKERMNIDVPMEIRAVDADKGIFEGYASVFDVVDSYGSQIMRGAFTKTLQERGDKVKVLWNHDDDAPIGKPLEMREDSHGLFVRAQLTRGVQRAEEALLLMKDGVINTLSIGFSIPRGKESLVDGVRQINEVKLYEFSPVVFESNGEAAITGVRSQEFDTTVSDELLENGHWRLLDALKYTLMDIWWAGDNRQAADVESLLAKACDDFTTAYKSWASEYAPLVFPENEENVEGRASAPFINELSKVVLEHMRSKDMDCNAVAMATSMTLEEVRSAMRGEPVQKLASELGCEVGKAYKQQRRTNIEQIAEHLRGDLNAAERNQLSALLNIQPQSTDESEAVEPSEPQQALTKLMDEVRSFNKKQ